MSKINVNTVDTQCGSTLTLGSSGKTVTLASGASQSGFGRTGTVDWCTTAKTSPFTAVSGDGFFVNTTSGAITVTLPASPSAGDIVAFKDYANTWDTNTVTLCRNGSKINGEADNAKLKTEAQSVTLIYVDSTKGWQDIHDSTSNITGGIFVAATGGTVITCGDFKTHVFTSSGCFQVTCAGSSGGSNTIDYFVVAGGGGGSGYYYAGGGGAGGFRMSNSYSVPAPTTSPLANPTGITAAVQTYPITVGAGGANGGNGVNGSNGSNSIFSTITSTGGGGGSNNDDPTPAGGDGGSGGGSSGAPPGTAGSGNTPPVSPPQGNPGGTGNAPPNNPAGGFGGGGGGAGAAGATAGIPGPGGAGGVGSYLADTVLGPSASSYGTPGPVSSTRYFAGGGGGGGNSTGTQGGTGGAGGGSDGAPNHGGSNATANTGGGGGGGSHAGNSPFVGTSGGSGIVILRYKFQ